MLPCARKDNEVLIMIMSLTAGYNCSKFVDGSPLAKHVISTGAGLTDLDMQRIYELFSVDAQSLNKVTVNSNLRIYK